MEGDTTISSRMKDWSSLVFVKDEL